MKAISMADYVDKFSSTTSFFFIIHFATSFCCWSFSTSYEMEADGHWPAIFIRSNFCFKYSIWSSQTQNIFNILSICYKDHEKCNRQFWVRILKISTTFLIYNLPLFFITTQKELKHKLVALQLPSLPAASPLSIF